MTAGAERNGAAVVVPVKAFGQAKMRLAAVLGPGERSELARKMAARVLRAASPLPVFVVCDDPEVAEWAATHGAHPLLGPGLGLNGAVNAAFSRLGDEGWGQVVVAHGDLPLATNFSWLAEATGIVLVPDRHEDGTNVISLPTGCGFRFSYGPGSFARHRREAERTGVPWQVLHDSELAWDIDVPADLAEVGKGQQVKR